MKIVTMYAWNVAVLLGTRRINWRTALHGLRHRPIALCGRGGNYIVDPEWVDKYFSGEA